MTVPTFSSFADAWDHFERRVVPADAQDGQRSDMKMSFYAGAFALLHTQRAIHDALDELGMQASFDAMKSVEAEIRAFFESQH